MQGGNLKCNNTIIDTFLLTSTEERGSEPSALQTKGKCGTERQKSRDSQTLLKTLLKDKKISMVRSSMDEGLEVNHLLLIIHVVFNY